jgi:hypothetical protein
MSIYTASCRTGAYTFLDLTMEADSADETTCRIYLFVTTNTPLTPDHCDIVYWVLWRQFNFGQYERKLASMTTKRFTKNDNTRKEVDKLHYKKHGNRLIGTFDWSNKLQFNLFFS